MSPDFAPLKEFLGRAYDVVESSARSATEGVWYADRKLDHGPIAISNGVWWTHSGSHVVSLAHGTGFHGFGGYDWETYVFLPKDVDLDICCHGSFEAAEACALSFINQGCWCRQYEDAQ